MTRRVDVVLTYNGGSVHLSMPVNESIANTLLNHTVNHVSVDVEQPPGTPSMKCVYQRGKTGP